MSQYEIAPTEPLHDIKGHFSNLIEESIHIATGSAQVEIKKIRSTILNKDTLRGSDYRKAVILIYIKLREINADQMLTDVYRTAVEIGHMLYAHDSKRTPRSILCLHNRAFVHAYLCGKLFASPHSITRRKMFGRYYHSITTHVPILFRIICLRSLNTESQERIFNRVKQITKATSNKQPNHIISNIIQRLHFEQKERSNDSVAIQESEVEVLAAAVGPMPNTTIKTAMMSEASSHYQAHLERISDFLLPGRGVWWRQTLDGIEFLDGDAENDFNAERSRTHALSLLFNIRCRLPPLPAMPKMYR